VNRRVRETVYLGQLELGAVEAADRNAPALRAEIDSGHLGH
jgi:hypothetical protein